MPHSGLETRSIVSMRAPPHPLVSVVTPVYNEEKYLAECIESVRAQTYQHWEYTILDNCSSDGSLEIARRYAAKDSRIRVVASRDFLRALPNFNRALRQISPESKYCKMVLADDWLFPECIERMVDLAEAYPSVGLVSAYALEGSGVALTGVPAGRPVLDGRDACRRHLLDRQYFFGTQTSVLYRSDLVRCSDSFYNESNVQADTEACFRILASSDFGFVHQVLTFTRVRPGSINAASMELQTSCAALLHLLLTYGSTCLTGAELKERLTQHLSEYYRFLGKSLILRRDKRFWAYHRGRMEAAGVGFDRSRVVAGLFAALLKAVRNPEKASERLARRIGLASR
jgi:glycosyltransferase involved in cell wall biosynthesis